MSKILILIFGMLASALFNFFKKDYYGVYASYSLKIKKEKSSRLMGEANRQMHFVERLVQDACLVLILSPYSRSMHISHDYIPI